MQFANWFAPRPFHIIIAGTCALGVALGEYLFLRGVSIFGSTNPFLLLLGICIYIVSCILYLHSVAHKTWVNAVILTLAVVVCVLPLTLIIVLPSIDGITNRIEATGALVGLSQSGSFSAGIISLFLIVGLATAANLGNPDTWLRAILAIIIGLAILLLIEAVLALPLRRAGTSLTSERDLIFSTVYTVFLWIITTIVVSPRA